MDVVGGEDDDLEQFMEVVTMYRCKFCTFSASSPREMALHVKCAHIKKTPYSGKCVNRQGPHYLIGDWSQGPSSRGILRCFEEIGEY